MAPSNPGWFYGHRDPAGTGGVCGQFDDDAQEQTVTVFVGPSRSISLELSRISRELYAATYDHCYTATSIGALVQRAFTGTSLRPRFAITAPAGGSRSHGIAPTANSSIDRAKFLPGSISRHPDRHPKTDSAISRDASALGD